MSCSDIFNTFTSNMKYKFTFDASLLSDLNCFEVMNADMHTEQLITIC